MKLREYQNEAIEAIFKDWAEHQFVMVSLATGLGKTVIFSATVGRFLENPAARKVMVVAHRTELLTQARDKMLAVVPELADQIGIYQGTCKEIDKRVIVASVQSCSAKRLAELPLAEVDLLIIDEFHHAPAAGYKRLIEALKAQNPSFKGLGVTATPFRGDKMGLGGLVSKITYSMPIRRGIDEGFLAPLRGVQVQLSVDFNSVRSSHGDFNLDDLAAVVDEQEQRDTFVKAWLMHAGPFTQGASAQGRSTACFTPTVLAAQNLTQTFLDHGVHAEWLSGETKAEEREDRLRRFAEGHFPVIVNCGVLTEGWDAPRTSCIALMRPTKSQVLYIQMVGRGTRLFEGKTDCLVLDCVGTTQNNSLITIADLTNGKLDGTKKEVKDKTPEELHLDLLGDPVSSVCHVKGFDSVEFDIFGRSPVCWFKVKEARVTSDGFWSYLIYESGAGVFTAIKSSLRHGMMHIASGALMDVTKAAELEIIASVNQHGDRKLMVNSKWLASKRASEKQVNFIGTLVAALRSATGNPQLNPGWSLAEIKAMSAQGCSVVISYMINRVCWARLQNKSAASA